MYFYLLLVTFTLTIDCFISALTFGLIKISVSLKHIFFISFFTSLFSTLAYFLGTLLDLSSLSQARFLIAFIFISMGIFKIGKIFFNKYFKALNQKRNSHLTRILSLKAMPEVADIDNSRDINFKESLIIISALSIDGIVGGGALALINNQLIYILFFFIVFFLFTFFLFFSGLKLGQKFKGDFTIANGIVLIILGLIYLF